MKGARKKRGRVSYTGREEGAKEVLNGGGRREKKGKSKIEG